jgi:Flp pilus assembly protein TadG
MQKIYHSSERGQAIVFLVIGLVVFLGFVGLAIDGGMAYSDRRYAQNSSDASSLAGGGEAALYLENTHVYWETWSCSDPNVITAANIAVEQAIQRALTNGYIIDQDDSDGNYVTTSCGQSTINNFTDKYLDVTVGISTTTETSFAHVLFPDLLHIRVDATTRIRPRQPFAFGNTIVSLNPDDCEGHQNGGVYYGNSTVTVVGGGIWTNGCLRGNGHPYVIVDNGSIGYGGEFEPGNTIWDPYPPDDPINYQVPPSLYLPEPPNCIGRWVQDSDIPRDGTPLDPGLYCFAGNLTFNAHDLVIGQGVTFVIYGDVTFNGQATIQISAPVAEPDPSPALAGVLIYVPHDPPDAACPDQEVVLNGTADSYFQGLIIAPCATITLVGNGSSDTYYGQIIGWNVIVGGEADTTITFDETIPDGLATRIELYR